LLGFDEPEPDFSDVDIAIFQKKIHSRKQILHARRTSRKLFVLDMCDPARTEQTRMFHRFFDLIICSSHELQALLIKQGLKIPSETILDPHEADPSFLKTHKGGIRPKITWYGISDNYPQTIQPLQSLLNSGRFEFHWAAEENSPWKDEPGFQAGIKWDLPMRDAWLQVDSWQRFIQQSDIGLVPVFGAVKSPHKILNYMAYGIPVICSPTDAHKRIITHGETGFFASTAAEWDEYLRLLSDPEIRRRIGANARRLVLEEFSAENIADKYLQVLMKHLERKKTGGVLGRLNGLREFLRILC